MSTLGPGAVFGEMALFLGERTADVIASSELVRLLALSDSTLRALQTEHPELAHQLLWNLCRALCIKVATA